MNAKNIFSQPGLIIAIAILFLSQGFVYAQESAKEEDYFRIMKVSSPEGTLLEVGGLCTLPNGDLAITTRRGDVFIVENPTSQRPHFRKFASGMHEVLGVAYKNGALYCAQRGELTKLVDTDMDGKADVYETVYAWPITGNYHEYSFGPKIAPDGSFFVTLNLGFWDDWWHPKSRVPWRGWALRIQEDGTMEPWANGLRSPCGISMIDGELYYTENQGDWVSAGALIPLKKGTFAGHPASLVWDSLPNSPIHVSQQQIFSHVSPRIEFDKQGRPYKPQDITNEKFVTKADIKKVVPELQLPLVYLPHSILGISTGEAVKIPDGSFGPFAGQILIGDQGQSIISRVFLEKVNGELQGASWMFRSGLQSGVVRLAWGKDGSLFVGETNRGWGSAGDANEGLQRLVWNKRVPFEMRTIKAMPDGFEIEFTRPAEKKFAEDIASYAIESFTYKYHAVYGSPMVNTMKHKIRGVKVSPDGMRARIIVDGLRKNYIHTITLEGVRDKETAYSLVHPTAYYTLNNIPDGAKLSMAEVSTKNSAAAKPAKPTVTTKTTASKTGTATKALTYNDIKPLLTKYTCVSCHNPTTKQVGPAFVDIAQKKYSIAKMVNLMYNPDPRNWPGYAVAMPPMKNVPKADAEKIAAWIKTMEKK
jgi:cytochrome c551/c552